MRAQGMNVGIAILAVLYGAGAFFLPVEVLEVLGAPLVVAAAYYGGLRGGAVVGLWAVLVATFAFVVLHEGELWAYLVAATGYVLIGVLVGLAVDRLVRQNQRLEGAVEFAGFARKQLAASEERYRLLFESSNDAVYVHGLDGDGEPTRFLSVNDAACERLGYTREELIRRLTPRAIDAAPEPGQLRRMMSSLLRHGSVMYESVIRTRDGQRIPVEVSSSLTEVDGELTILSISRDISERKRAERRLEDLTLRDELTGLFNRRGFGVMLAEQAKRSKRSGRPVIVMYGDIDDFKEFNDTQGHERGDEVLLAVSDALRHTFRDTDLVARLGGDEFCVIAEAEEGTDPAMFGDRLDEALLRAGEELGSRIGLSHGEVVTDWRGLDDPRTILARADARMYEAKRAKTRGER